MAAFAATLTGVADCAEPGRALLGVRLTLRGDRKRMVRCIGAEPATKLRRGVRGGVAAASRGAEAAGRVVTPG